MKCIFNWLYTNKYGYIVFVVLLAAINILCFLGYSISSRIALISLYALYLLVSFVGIISIDACPNHFFIKASSIYLPISFLFINCNVIIASPIIIAIIKILRNSIVDFQKTFMKIISTVLVTCFILGTVLKIQTFLVKEEVSPSGDYTL